MRKRGDRVAALLCKKLKPTPAPSVDGDPMANHEAQSGKSESGGGRGGDDGGVSGGVPTVDGPATGDSESDGEGKSVAARWREVTGGRTARALVEAELARLVEAGAREADFAAALAVLAGGYDACHYGDACECRGARPTRGACSSFAESARILHRVATDFPASAKLDLPGLSEAGLTTEELDALAAACPDPAASRCLLAHWIDGCRELTGGTRVAAIRAAATANDYCNHMDRVAVWAARRVRDTAPMPPAPASTAVVSGAFAAVAAAATRRCRREAAATRSRSRVGGATPPGSARAWGCFRRRRPKSTALARLREAFDRIFAAVAAPGEDDLGCKPVYCCALPLSDSSGFRTLPDAQLARLLATLDVEHAAYVEGFKTALAFWALERAACRGRAAACLFARASAIDAGADASLSDLRVRAAEWTAMREARGRLFVGLPLSAHLAALAADSDAVEGEWVDDYVERRRRRLENRRRSASAACRVLAVRDAAPVAASSDSDGTDVGVVPLQQQPPVLRLGEGAPSVLLPLYPVFTLALSASDAPRLVALLSSAHEEEWDYIALLRDAEAADAATAERPSGLSYYPKCERRRRSDAEWPAFRIPCAFRILCAFRLVEEVDGVVRLEATPYDTHTPTPRDWKEWTYGSLRSDPHWHHLSVTEWAAWTRVCADSTRLLAPLLALAFRYAGLARAAAPPHEP